MSAAAAGGAGGRTRQRGRQRGAGFGGADVDFDGKVCYNGKYSLRLNGRDSEGVPPPTEPLADTSERELRVMSTFKYSNTPSEQDNSDPVTDNQIDVAIYILNDWSSGQLQSLQIPNYYSASQLETALRLARIADQYRPEQLTDDGQWVVSVILSTVPKLLRQAEEKAEKQRIKNTVAPTSRSSREGYVYLLQSPTTAFKIGYTKNPADRMRTFGIQLPFEVEYLCLIKTDDMISLESDLHNLYSEKRINGEWFALDPEDVEYIKGLAK